MKLQNLTQYSSEGLTALLEEVWRRTWEYYSTFLKEQWSRKHIPEWWEAATVIARYGSPVYRTTQYVRIGKDYKGNPLKQRIRRAYRAHGIFTVWLPRRDADVVRLVHVLERGLRQRIFYDQTVDAPLDEDTVLIQRDPRPWADAYAGGGILPVGHDPTADQVSVVDAQIMEAVKLRDRLTRRVGGLMEQLNELQDDVLRADTRITTLQSRRAELVNQQIVRRAG